MPKLVLIKHSLPDVRPDEPPSRWPLSDEGARRARLLAEVLAPLNLAAFYASRELKAVQTAALAADSLRLPFFVREGLHEHDREGEPFSTAEEFEAKVRALFERPRRHLFGSETAEEALTRFEGAIAGVLAEAQGADIAVVAHGTVISLLAASRCGVDGFETWSRLGLPSYLVLETPAFELVDVVEALPAHS